MSVDVEALVREFARELSYKLFAGHSHREWVRDVIEKATRELLEKVKETGR